ncbi:hypothetical protein GCM10007301_26610 [Azorhizobium oxalatiphilum]|uniref:Uncharacterized protein n=1 Tax=Azorhizobium oxalatiphilum TaxID=980631 RepID=A0A917C041_9HYPH|nr:hypothetical protein GCM10007301_26610 [Azorhizobium oxalatiphilum]
MMAEENRGSAAGRRHCDTLGIGPHGSTLRVLVVRLNVHAFGYSSLSETLDRTQMSDQGDIRLPALPGWKSCLMTRAAETPFPGRIAGARDTQSARALLRRRPRNALMRAVAGS